MRADVIIVGAGLAGLVAAIEARAHQASVLLVEKLPPPEQWNVVVSSTAPVSSPASAIRFRGARWVECGPGTLRTLKAAGGVAEWSIATVLKTVMG